MLEIADTLPPGALLGQARAAVADSLPETGALWLEAGTAAYEMEGDAVTGWTPRHGTISAIPNEPNIGNGQTADFAGRAGLLMRAGLHCGFVAPQVTQDASAFSMAVIYQPAPEGEARTLLTLNTGYNAEDEGTSNYIFLSDGGGDLTLKDTKGAIGLNAPVTADADSPRLLVVTLAGAELALQENRGPVHRVAGLDPGMQAPGDLFIGCRSHRKGLKKTLGDSIILDVFFWPDHRLLLPRHEADRDQHAALQRLFLWDD